MQGVRVDPSALRGPARRRVDLNLLPYLDLVPLEDDVVLVALAVRLVLKLSAKALPQGQSYMLLVCRIRRLLVL